MDKNFVDESFSLNLTALRAQFPESTESDYRRLIMMMSPEGRRQAQQREIRDSQPKCIGEIYQGYLIEIRLVCTHMKSGRLVVVVHLPNGDIVRPILNYQTGNLIKPNAKNSQSTVDWVTIRTRNFIDRCIASGTYTHCF
jgi:hypothetical protein